MRARAACMLHSPFASADCRHLRISPNALPSCSPHSSLVAPAACWPSVCCAGMPPEYAEGTLSPMYYPRPPPETRKERWLHILGRERQLMECLAQHVHPPSKEAVADA